MVVVVTRHQGGWLDGVIMVSNHNSSGSGGNHSGELTRWIIVISGTEGIAARHFAGSRRKGV